MAEPVIQQAYTAPNVNGSTIGYNGLNTTPGTILAADAGRGNFVLSNPGTVPVLVYQQQDTSGTALAPTFANPGGGIILSGGDSAEVSGEAAQGAWSAVASAANGNLTIFIRSFIKRSAPGVGAVGFLRADKNLSDLSDVDQARENLGLGSAALEDASAFQPHNGNLDTLSAGTLGATGLAVLAADDEEEARTAIDESGQILTGEGFKLTYQKARGSWHIKAFGATLTDVGSGNANVDTAALQTAMASGEIIDITGSLLSVNAPIPVTVAGANILSEKATRVGVNAGSKITVVDDTIPKLFDIQQPNFEASGFFIECGTGNVATTLFHFERAPGSPSDIDAELVDIGHEGGAKLFHHYGRGLKLLNITSGNVKTCVGDMDWPASWTPNGQSNDLQETAMRGYQFHVIRMHGAASGIRNIGANRLNLRGVTASDWQGDIGVGGGGLFVGVPGVGSKFSNFVANIGATIAGGLLDLWEGSRDATFLNMSCAGIKTAAVTRLNRTAIIIRSTTAAPTQDLTFTNMNIGPTNRSGVIIQGGGAAQNISFIGGSWDRTNIEGTTHFPIFVNQTGDTFTEVSIKLTACNFKFGGETAPTFIIGGLNSSLVHAYINSGNTKPAAIPWAQGSVVVTT